ncbi:T9SS type A sorting domain-containing protein [Larkinella terrae]|uniref:T9SS type A sorting domain-containing protein n=1 Tax=Larkinella terrae TaxID=2025311 RepID=A0A7K0ETU9_9BACT|nr:T9SS type A sorting domain-containing protein [Larkinella terrae]MRS65235.1 T9SS type A sorting domain-containing protein [Larkinella terrae]
MKKSYGYLVTCFLFVVTSLVGYAQQNGIVKTERTSPRGIVSFSQSSKPSGISDTKHVDGYVKKYGTGLFAFPVGHKGVYRPFVADADGTTGAYFQENPGSAQLPAGGPFAVSNKESAVTSVSAKEFWDIDGTTATRLTLTWNAASAIGELTGNALSYLSIVGWNSATSRWEKIASLIDSEALQGGTSTLTAGSITSIASVIPDAYSVYSLAATNSSQLPVSYGGKLETASCTEVKGWAWDNSYPNAALTVELLEGTTVQATATANLYREDLKNAGIGTGNYGFSIPLPATLTDGNEHQISVRVRSSTYTLTDSPKTVSCGYGGKLESATCTEVIGWGWDKNSPNSALTVELTEGNTVYATTTANIFREDLKNAGTATGNYGFKIPFPNTLKDSKIHQVSVRVKNVNYTFAGSPKMLSCAPPQYLGRFEGMDCNVAVGWVWDMSNPTASLTVELVEGNTVHATGPANQFLAGLKNTALGSTGNYGFSIPLPTSLKDGKSHQLSIRVQGSSYALTDSPKTLNCPLNSFLGRFEGMDCNVAVGWVWDKNNPNAALTVELVEGNTVYATAVANQFLAGLKNTALGSTGNYGFGITLPNSLKDGKPHQLGIRVQGTTFALTDSPRTLNCATNDYLGRFEGLDCNVAVGWVWDKNNPNATLTVELVEGNTVYATAVANQFLAGLKNTALGSTGNYGFGITLPNSLKDGKPHQLSIRVQGSTYALTDSPKTLNCPSNVYLGRFEGLDCNLVAGWAWDMNNPAAALTVELVEGNTVYATALANQFMAGLKNTALGSTGNYGFSLPVPASLKDGKSHQLSLRVQGSTYILTDSPKTLNCASNVYLGRFEGLNCTLAAGWVWDMNNPNSALTVELVEGNTVHATGLANTFLAGLKNTALGSTGNYGFSLPLPAGLKDGKAHQLGVRVKNTTYTLTDSPKTITCSSSGRLAVANDAAADWELVIAPNPAVGMLTATFGLDEQQTATLSIVNVLGQLVWQQSITGKGQNNQQTIDLSSLAEGVYFFRFKVGERVETKRFILTH